MILPKEVNVRRGLGLKYFLWKMVTRVEACLVYTHVSARDSRWPFGVMLRRLAQKAAVVNLWHKLFPGKSFNDLWTYY
jgi:hypothetical protein